MNESRDKLTLDHPATYQIKVAGQLNGKWAEWDERMTITSDFENENQRVTILTCTLDQAGLQGLLRRLYSFGLPLISVICLDYEGASPVDK